MNARQFQMPLYVYIGGGIVFLLFAILFKPFTVINVGERGVIMHFGEVQEQILNEGFHPILPIFTNIKKMSIRVKKVDVSKKCKRRNRFHDFSYCVLWMDWRRSVSRQMPSWNAIVEK